MCPNVPGLDRLPARAERVAHVLDDPEVVTSRHLEDAIDVERVPERVGQDDRPRPGADRLLEKLRVEVVGRELDVEEDRHETVLEDRVEGRRETGRARDDLVARLQPTLAEHRRGQRRQREEVRRGARVDEERETDSHGTRDGTLELVREPPGGQPEVERGVDEMPDVVGVEDLSADRDRRLAGDERPIGPPCLAVLGDQGEDPGAELLVAHAAPRNARYQGTVLSSPSRRDRPGAQPRRRRALARVERLVADLGPRGIEDDRRKVLPSEDREEQVDDLPYARRGTGGEVEDVARPGGSARREGEREIGVDDVVDVDVVARVAAVGTDDGPLAAQDRTDRARDDAAPGEVAASVDVPAARHGHREPVRVRVGPRQEVGAALRDVVGVAPGDRHLFGVREDGDVAVGLVAGGDDDRGDLRAGGRLRGGCRCRGRSPRTSGAAPRARESRAPAHRGERRSRPRSPGGPARRRRSPRAGRRRHGRRRSDRSGSARRRGRGRGRGR